MNTTNPVILIVDDNLTDRKLFEFICIRLGYTTSSAENGQEALKLMHARQYNLVLLDWLMPRMGGAETVSAIRSGAVGSSHAQLPIIAVTADIIRTSSNSCLKAGTTEYLVKPFHIEEMITLLHRWLPNMHTPFQELFCSHSNIHKYEK